MLSTTRPESTARGPRSEHQSIAAAVKAMEARLKRLGDGKPDAGRSGEVVRGLEGLAREIVEHFAREEAPEGIFAKALVQAPRVERRVAAVRRQHGPLGTELARIVEDAGYAGVAPHAWQVVAERFHAFAETLCGHERAEEGILTDAYLDDLGGGD